MRWWEGVRKGRELVRWLVGGVSEGREGVGEGVGRYS